MSRIGKQPVVLPAGVKAQVADGKVRVEGPKGKLELTFHRNMKVQLDDKTKAIQVNRPDDERLNRALHGLTRSLIANMVEGVTKGFEKKLKIEGIGYQARMDKKAVVLTVGYANSVTMSPPDSVTPRSRATSSRVRNNNKPWIVAFTRLIGFVLPWVLVKIFFMPQASKTSRTPGPALTPVPGPAGTRTTRLLPNRPMTR